MSRQWKLLLAGVIAAVPLLVAWGYDRLQTMSWVGYTDLEVEFAVTDAETGVAIEGATINQVNSEGGTYHEEGEKSFSLNTDARGFARRTCTRVMCSGGHSGLGFEETYTVDLPWWYYRISAPGYETTSVISLNEIENVRRVQRIGRGQAKLVAPTAIRKVLAKE
jgi:hypothetical protein